MNEAHEDAILKHIADKDFSDAKQSAIGSAAAYGTAGATPREQMEYVWNVACRYTVDRIAKGLRPY